MGDVGVAVVKRYGMDGYEDGGWTERRDRFGDEGVFWTRSGEGGSAVGKAVFGEGGAHGELVMELFKKEST